MELCNVLLTNSVVRYSSTCCKNTFIGWTVTLKSILIGFEVQHWHVHNYEDIMVYLKVTSMQNACKIYSATKWDLVWFIDNNF